MKEYARYAIGVLFIIGAIVLIVVGFNLIRSIFKGSDKDTQQTQHVDLGETASSGMPVRYTISGSTVGKDRHRAIRITVDRNSRRIDIVEGYDEQIVKSEQFDNTQAAYSAFVSALRGAGYTDNVDPEGRGDENRSCPLGLTYIYEVNPGSSGAFRTWSNSCSERYGSFAGNDSLVRQLFQLQIPDYSRYVSDTRLDY